MYFSDKFQQFAKEFHFKCINNECDSAALDKYVRLLQGFFAAN
jgi:hypothetical protein